MPFTTRTEALRGTASFPMPHIRIATPSDGPAIAALVVAFRKHLQRALPSDEDLSRSAAQLIAASDAEFYVCTVQRQTVGYVLQRFRHSMWANGMEATIEDLFVHPDARTAGLGRQLVHIALERAREKQCHSVCLDTNENNTASQRIYTSCGFNSFSSRWNGHQMFFRLHLA